MNEVLATLQSYCSPDGTALPLGMLLLGLSGGVVHCAAMCGPFVLGQVSDRLARVPAHLLCERSRVSTALLLPYHCGRLITYAGLGAVLSATAGRAAGAIAAGPLPGVLLLAGAAMFLSLAAGRISPALRRGLSGLRSAPPALVRLIGAIAGRLDRGRWTGGLLLGAVLGFLPCGLLYAALLAAAAAGSAGGGAVTMLAFGIGTVPSLVLVGLVGAVAARRWQVAFARLAPIVMLGNAAVLGVMGWRSLAF